MEYTVIPFVASLDPKKGKSNDVAQQLENTINKFKEKGWTYVRLESVSTYVQPDNGCFGLGSRPGYNTYYQMIVFQIN